jgi:hypothetical protein
MTLNVARKTTMSISPRSLYSALLLFAFALLGCHPVRVAYNPYIPPLPTCAPPPAPTSGGRKFGAAGAQPPFTVSGTAGTYTVLAGYYVVSVSAHATSAGSLTVTASGPYVTSPVTWAAITIPAGSAWGLSVPVLTGAPNELGVGSVFVFSGTDAYTIVMNQI